MAPITPATDRTRRRPGPLAPPRWPLLGLAALLLLCTSINIHVVERDSLPMVADASGYFRTSLTWYRLFRDGNPGEVLHRSQNANVRPPLPQLVTVGVFYLTGTRSQSMARHSILLFLWILLISTYAIGARLRDRPTGLVAATLLACYPQVVGYSRIYWMDLPLAAMTALAIWLLLASRGFSRRGASVGFGVAVGLGMLTKYTLPVFLVGPLACVLVERVQRIRSTSRSSGPAGRRLQVRRLLENMSLSLLAGMLVCGFWYVNTIGAAWNNFIFNQGVGVLRPRAWWTLSNLLLYLRHLAVQLGPLNIVALVLALPLFLRHADRRAVRLLLSWFIIPYLFFTYLVLGMEWTRFTLPYLPAVALVTAVGLLQFRFSALARAAGGAVCALAVLGALRLSFAAPPELMPGTFIWRRIRTTGMMVSQSYDFYLDVRQIFPPTSRPGTRYSNDPRSEDRFTHVAIFPDAGSIASLLETWSIQQQAPIRFSVPHEPEGRSFGRFPYPERVSNLEYLLRHHYVVRMVAPGRIKIHVRRPDIYRRFLRLWEAHQHLYELVDERRLPNGFRLLIHRKRGK